MRRSGQRLARGLERRRDLGRVMRVVVDHDDATARGLELAERLQPPVDALELRERAGDRRVADLELRGHRDRGERVQHVVPARQVERDRQRGGAAGPDHVEAATARRDARGSPRARRRRRRTRSRGTAAPIRGIRLAVTGSSLQITARP